MYKGRRMYVVIIILMIRTFVALDIPVYEEGVKSPKEHHQYSFELITNCISFHISNIRFHIIRYRNFVYNLDFQSIFLCLITKFILLLFYVYNLNGIKDKHPSKNIKVNERTNFKRLNLTFLACYSFLFTKRNESRKCITVLEVRT